MSTNMVLRTPAQQYTDIHTQEKNLDYLACLTNKREKEKVKERHHKTLKTLDMSDMNSARTGRFATHPRSPQS